MKHYAILFNRKSGKAIKIIEQQFGDAMLKIVGLNNTKSTQDYIVFNEVGIVTAYYEGKKNDLPNICNDCVGKSVLDFGFDVKVIL